MMTCQLCQLLLFCCMKQNLLKIVVQCIVLFNTNFRSIEQFSYDLEKWFRLSVRYLFYQRSEHGLFVFPLKKTLICRRHCSIGQSCCSMMSKHYEPQGRFSCTHQGSLISMEIPTNWTQVTTRR